MAEGVDDVVGGVFLAWAFVHLVAATLESADWARLRATRRVTFFRGALTFLAALRITSSEGFACWVLDGTWLGGAFLLLILPALVGRHAERWLSISRLRFGQVRSCCRAERLRQCAHVHQRSRPAPINGS